MILALSGNAWNRYHIAEYGCWLTARNGLLTFAQVTTGTSEQTVALRDRHLTRLREFISAEGLEAFPLVVVDKDRLNGIRSILQCYGFGGVKPNTVMMGWFTDEERFESNAAVMRLLSEFKRSIVIVKCDEHRERWTAPQGSIDIWWNSRQNGPLMLLLAHLLVQNKEFGDRTIRIFSVIQDESARDGVTAHLSGLLENSRIEAVVEVILSRDIPGEMRVRSRKAAVTLLGFEPPAEGGARAFHVNYHNVLEHLDTVILVHSAQDVDLNA